MSIRRELRVGDDDCEGTCSTWVSGGRGYGFITVPGVTKDIFVPSRNLLNAIDLAVGDRVAFEVRMGYDGKLMADSVELLAPQTSRCAQGDEIDGRVLD